MNDTDTFLLATTHLFNQKQGNNHVLTNQI